MCFVSDIRVAANCTCSESVSRGMTFSADLKGRESEWFHSEEKTINVNIQVCCCDCWFESPEFWKRQLKNIIVMGLMICLAVFLGSNSDYHKLEDAGWLKVIEISFSHFWGPESQRQVLVRLDLFQRLQGTTTFLLPLSACSTHSLACGHKTSVSTSFFTWPPPVCLCLLLLFLRRTHH